MIKSINTNKMGYNRGIAPNLPKSDKFDQFKSAPPEHTEYFPKVYCSSAVGPSMVCVDMLAKNGQCIFKSG